MNPAVLLELLVYVAFGNVMALFPFDSLATPQPLARSDYLNFGTSLGIIFSFTGVCWIALKLT